MRINPKNRKKQGVIDLVRNLKSLDFELIDCQIPIKHLKCSGAVEMAGAKFFKRLNRAVEHETLRGSWSSLKVKT